MITDVMWRQNILYICSKKGQQVLQYLEVSALKIIQQLVWVFLFHIQKTNMDV